MVKTIQEMTESLKEIDITNITFCNDSINLQVSKRFDSTLEMQHKMTMHEQITISLLATV